MKLIPVKSTYLFDFVGHEARVDVLHSEIGRTVTFSFDNRAVTEKIMAPDSLSGDADCIRAAAREYLSMNNGKYADVIKNHADKMIVKSKTLQLQIDNGIVLDLEIQIIKNIYDVKISTFGSSDKIACKFEANSFSEALEKIRLFMSILGDFSLQLTSHINELSNDKILELFHW